MNKSKIQGHVAMLFTSLIFGVNIPLSKNLMPDWMSPLGLTYSRFAFGAMAFWLLSLFLKSEKVTRKDMGTLFLGSLLGVGVNQAAFIAGLQMTSATNASIVITVTPILAMIISFFILKEPITFKKAGGVVIGLVGVLSMILTSEISASGREASMIGDFLCVLSSLSYAFFLVLTRGISKRYSSVTIMKWMFLFSALMFLPFGYKDVLSAKLFAAGTSAAWSSYFYLLVGATFITYLLIPVAQKEIRPTTIGMYNYLQPLVASFIAIMWGQDIFSWTKPLSALLIFSGVYFVTTSKSREDVERERILKLGKSNIDDLQLCPVKEKVNKV
ncbi:MAG TPA: DMT family transporter [Prolixibacteraceae bacterium]|jgi:drug/metabolite transporter (DMT)-like permease